MAATEYFVRHTTCFIRIYDGLEYAGLRVGATATFNPVTSHLTQYLPGARATTLTRPNPMKIMAHRASIICSTRVLRAAEKITRRRHMVDARVCSSILPARIVSRPPQPTAGWYAQGLDFNEIWYENTTTNCPRPPT